MDSDSEGGRGGSGLGTVTSAGYIIVARGNILFRPFMTDAILQLIS